MRVDTERGFAERLWPARVDRLHADPRWLRANAGRPGHGVHTIRVSDDAGTVSALAYVYRAPAASEAYDLHRLLLGDPPVFEWSVEGRRRLRALLDGDGSLPSALFPAVTVVLPGYDAGCVSSGGAAAHLDALVASVAGLAAGHAAATCAFLYVPREDSELTAALRRASFVPVALTARASLRVRWSTLPGYTASFPRHRRHKLRNELARLQRLGVRSRRADPLQSLEIMVRLRCAHVRKFGREPDEAAERRRLAQVLDNFPERDFSLVLTGRGDTDASCALFLRHGNRPREGRLHLVLAATDPDAGLPYAHYESAFYAPIRLGVTAAGAEVDYGISHLEHKVLRGCVAAPLDAWVRVAGEGAGGTLRSLSELSLAHRVEAMPTLTRPLDIISAAGVDFVTGVPDSELAPLVADLERGHPGVSYLAATREDNAVALAAGAALGGATALVFMKSMGLGTAVDAITSLVKVYELPLVLYVSWVGYRGRDVPHHNVLGEVLEPTLASLGIPAVRHTIGRPAEMWAALRRAVELAGSGPGPVAVLAVPPQLREAAGDAP